MIRLLYSADHELYLGANFLPEETLLLAPTRQLLDACNGLGIPLTLFADVACLWRYREWGHPFAEAAREQLREAVAMGHDVQAHLHPHWLTCERDGTGYRFDPAHYWLGSLDPDPVRCRERATTLLRRAREWLEGTLQPVTPDYRCVAFRAGGYGLAPRQELVIQALLEAGFQVDSSVIPGYRSGQGERAVDFSAVPPLGNWRFSCAGVARPTPGAGLWEVPIAAWRFTPGEAHWLLWRQALGQAWNLLWHGQDHPPPRGRPWHAGDAPQQSPPSPPAPSPPRLKRAWWRWRGVMGRRHLRLELGGDPAPLLAVVTRQVGAWERAGRPGGALLISLNSHPKGLQPAHLHTLARVHRALERCYGDGYQAITFQQGAALLAALPRATAAE